MIAAYRSVFCVLLCVISYFGNAQELSISGKVIDPNGVPIEFANVILFESDSDVFLKGTSTDDRGIFKLENLSENTYNLKISYIGFKSFEQIIVLKGELDLREITLEESAES
jgi:hypothetical protein